MPTIAEIRQQYPQYKDMSDADLASALHKKFYSDMPEEDFNAKIGLGTSAKEDDGGVAGSIDAFGRSVANTAGLGFMDELGAAARWAGGKVFPWQSEVTYDQALAEVRGDDKRVAQEHPIANAAGILPGAIGLGTGIARLGLSPTTRAIEAGRGLGAVSVASGLEGAGLGAIQGAGDAEGGLSDRAENAGYGAIGGGLIGAATPAIMQGVGSVARRALSPFMTNPERTAAVNTLAREGVETTAGQRTGSDALRYAESEIGGRRAADLMERQGEQFTGAALRRAGTNAPRATVDVIDDNFRRIGQEFDDLAARNNLVPDNQLARDLGQTAREYMSMVPESQRAPVVMDMIQDLGTTLSQGPMDGAVYQAARSRLDRMARGAARDPQLQEALFGIRNALDDGMQRTLRQTNPQDLGRWQQVRREYRNMLTLERAATGAGENAAQGIISPSQLRNATVSTQGRRNYARGTGDFAELARAGEAVMKPMPNSGTAGRLNAQNLGIGLAGILGAGAGTATGDPTNALLAGAAGFAAPRVAGRVMMSPTMQRYLANQLATNVHWTPAQRAQVMRVLGITEAQDASSVGRSVVGAIAP